MMEKFHKINLITNIGLLGTFLSGLLWLMTHWTGITTFMTRLNSIYTNAPSMERLIEDYQIIHSIIAEEELQQADFDSLKAVVTVLSYGKAPYQDTIWYMNEYGQWIKCNIKDHPMINDR